MFDFLNTTLLDQNVDTPVNTLSLVVKVVG